MAGQWRAACDGRTRLALRLALARPHHSASTGCARAAGLAAARRDWQLAASRPASTQLSQLWAARPDGLARLSPRGGGLLPVASTLSSVLRHLRNRATVSSSSSSCECAALCRATPSAHQTARAQHATHGSKRRAIARRFHFGLRGTREIQSLTKDDTLRSQHKTHSLRSQLRPHTLSATSRPPCGRQYPEGPTPESNRPTSIGSIKS